MKTPSKSIQKRMAALDPDNTYLQCEGKGDANSNCSECGQPMPEGVPCQRLFLADTEGKTE